MPEVSQVAQALSFTVLGKAMPGGSKKAYVINGKAVVTEASNNKSWRQEVAAAGQLAMGSSPLLLNALEVSMTFVRPRPKGHYRSGKNAHLLKSNAPAWPTTKPDVLKLARLAEDALSSVVYRDDAQIAAEHLFKVYGVPERLEITVRELGLFDLFAQSVDLAL